MPLYDYLMTFDSDAFISYAHLDNLPLIEGDKGWVADFHRALEIRVGQLRGKSPQIWRDPKLQGNDYFADVLIERLARVAVLISIVSPPYLRSEWTRRELTEFQKAALHQGGLRIGDKARLFKVLKTWVPLDRQPPEVHDLLGYEFFKRDPVSGKVRELNRVFGEEAEREFWMRLDDLAHDVCELLDELEGGSGEPVTTLNSSTVYLAETTMDLKAEHESIRRELQEHGCNVLPASPLPVVESDLRAAVAEQLERCRLSIHMVGRHLSLVPEGGVESLIEVQNDLAIARAAKGSFSRLVWIPSGLQVEDERQRKLVEQFRMNPRMDAKSDLIETNLEGLRTVLQDRLRTGEKAQPQPDQPADTSHLTYLYFIYDQKDQDAIQPWQQFFFEQGLEVLHPYFEGSETEVRESHEENLQSCDAVLIHYGSAGEPWLRRKLRELQKCAGYAPTRPKRIVGLLLAPPKSSQKQCFQTHEPLVMIPQWEGFAAEPLLPFLREAKGQLQAGA